MGRSKIQRPQVLKIDAGLAALGWNLEGDELASLERSIVEEGCRDPVTYWEQDGVPLEESIVVDGHQRYKICHAHRLVFPVRGRKFESRDHVIIWMRDNQIGRRNATFQQKLKLNQEADNARLRIKERLEKELGSVVKAVEQTAEAAGVSPRQIYRSAAAALRHAELGEKSPVIQRAADEHLINKSDAIVLAKAPAEVLKSIEMVPPKELRAKAKEIASEMRGETQAGIPDNAPVVHIKALVKLEKQLGLLVRSNTEALDACKHAPWAKQHHEAIRQSQNAIAVEINQWQRDAEKQRR